MHTFSKSIQRELDDFFQRLDKSDFSIRKVTKGALTQARAKLKPEAFTILDKVTQENFYNGAAFYKWDKYKIKAVDGSTTVLPNHPSIVQEFGVHHFGPYADSPRSVARISLLYDPLNGIINDARIGGYETGEKELCNQHLEHVSQGDLVIFDRFYAGLDLMWNLHLKKVDFLFRMKETWWKVVRDFQQQDKDDQEIDLNCKDGKIRVRLIRVQLENEKTQIFCTSVLDNKFSAQDFGDLYRGRWGIEEAYKTLKNWIELANFSGKTALAVKQDFFSKIFLMNLCTAFAHPIADKIKKEKEDYQINRVQSIAMASTLPVSIFIKGKVRGALIAFDQLISKTIDIIRPDRKFKRKKRIRQVKFSMNYKKL
jgi:hypothetical protein